MATLVAGGFACALLLIGLAVAVYFREFGRTHPVAVEAVWTGLLFLGLLCFRYPFLRVNLEINVDESQMLAQAVRFSQDWMPWRSVDGTTGGPLNSYVLMWPMLFGIWPDYRTARFTGLLLIVASVCFLHAGFRQAVGRGASLCLVIGPILLYCLAVEPDLIHYSSEHVPLALCSMSFAFALAAVRSGSLLKYLATGVLLGALPFAKIQTAPIAVVALVIISGDMIVGRRSPVGDRLWQLVALAAGFALMPMLILIPVAMAGCWQDFWIRYIAFSLGYGPSNPTSRLATLWTLLANGLTAGTFLAAAVGGTGFLLGVSQLFARRRVSVAPLAGAIALGGASAFAVLKSNQPFPHYLHLLVVPSVLLLGAAYWFMTETFRSSPRIIHFVTAVLIVILVLPQLLVYGARGFPHRLCADWYSNDTPRNSLAELVRRNQREGEPIEVWGWLPSYYVMSRSMCATRDAICHAVLLKADHSHYYLTTHLADLRKSKPTFFIDAITEASHCPEWPPVYEIRAEAMPVIKEFLGEHYTKVGEAQMPGAASAVRVYVRNDRLADLKTP